MRKHPIVILILFFTARLLNAQNAQNMIDQHQSKLDNLASQILTMQQHLSTPDFMTQLNIFTYDQLNIVFRFVENSNREFTVLSQLFLMADLVTEKQYRKKTRQYIDRQRDYMLNHIQRHVDFVDQTIPKTKNNEASRLLREIRNLLKQSSDVAIKSTITYYQNQ